MIYEEIIQNIYLFQTESVVPLFVEISIMILIIWGVSFGLSFIVSILLNRNRRVLYGLIAYPIMIAIIYAAHYFIGPYFGLDYSQFSITEISNYIIQC